MKKNNQLELFRARLASLNSDGLNIQKINADYMCKYSSSLIGKHFKTISQVMEFVIYDLVPEDVLKAWQAIGTLVVLLWHTSIHDIDQYIVSTMTYKYILAMPLNHSPTGRTQGCN